MDSDGFFQFIVFILFFTDSIGYLFSESEEAQKPGAFYQ